LLVSLSLSLTPPLSQLICQRPDIGS